MSALLLFVAGGLVLAAALALTLARLPAAKPLDGAGLRLLDRAAATLVLALAVWTAMSWALAIPGVLDARGLSVAGALGFAVGTGLLVRFGAFRTRAARGRIGGAALLALAPVVLWAAFAAWRGSILPPYNHDALAYHFPKAALLMRARGYALFSAPEPRITTWPSNFELLLADFLTTLRSDHGSSLVGTMGFVGFVVLAALVAFEWWGGGAHVAITAAATAAAPIVLLHSGLEKNDLLEALFSVATFVWAARWYARGCTASLLLATTSLALALGTKLNGFFALSVALPVLAIGWWRYGRATGGRFAVYYVLSLPFLGILLGAWPYLVNLVVLHRLILMPENGGGYGHWFNVVEYTYLLFAAPFAPHGLVADPLRHGSRWSFPANDVWFSTFGAGFTVLLLLLVPCVLRYAKERPGTPRTASSAMALAAYAITLPMYSTPEGMGFTRYEIFVLPFLAAWTLSPIVNEVERRSGRYGGLADVLGALVVAATFSVEAWRYGIHDAYAPLRYVEAQLAHPTNRLPAVRPDRAALFFDKVAPPDAQCAIDVGFDTWISPAFGAGYTRTVEFLQRSPGAVSIPDDVDWVIVDRSWNAIFGNPGFTDMTKAFLVDRGAPTEDDTKVTDELLRDPAWELVYRYAPHNQALFHRRGSSGWPMPGQ